MRRTALAVVAGACALALATAPPALGQQEITDSAAAAQVGDVTVNAPVGSDRSDAGGGTGGRTQSAGDTTGSAQVGDVTVNAPIGSDDNDARRSGGSTQ